jgi:endonuclease/exonuclease/phosphatase family metal-dependent hydrolase
MRRRPVRLTHGALIALLGLSFLGVLGTPPVGAASPNSDRAIRVITVMTQNLDEGTDFTPLLTATTPAEFQAAALATLAEVFASDIPDRASQVAAEIAGANPALVSLQEVSSWQTPLGTIDALPALLGSLSADGARYTAAAVLPEFTATVTLPGVGTVTFLDRDVLLVRTAPLVLFSVVNIQSNHFTTLLTVPTLLGSLTETRGWISADVSVLGRTIRFIATHLEGAYPPVQSAQAGELLPGPANTSLPVILAGDLNTGPLFSGGYATPTYTQLLSGGFTDTWSATNPTVPGMTNPLHAEDPYGPSIPFQRIDLVLVGGGLIPAADTLVGTSPSPTSGLWPSDHAGVVATLRIP